MGLNPGSSLITYCPRLSKIFFFFKLKHCHIIVPFENRETEARESKHPRANFLVPKWKWGDSQKCLRRKWRDNPVTWQDIYTATFSTWDKNWLIESGFFILSKPVVVFFFLLLLNICCCSSWVMQKFCLKKMLPPYMILYILSWKLSSFPPSTL